MVLFPWEDGMLPRLGIGDRVKVHGLPGTVEDLSTVWVGVRLDRGDFDHFPPNDVQPV